MNEKTHKILLKIIYNDKININVNEVNGFFFLIQSNKNRRL